MQCHVCTALKHELGREGETEAAATLKQRAQLTAPVADPSTQGVLEDVILVSRKRRAHIATKLFAHQEDVHGEDADQSPGVRVAASA